MDLSNQRPSQEKSGQDKYQQELEKIYERARQAREAARKALQAQQAKKVAPLKEEKKDTSAFQGKPFLKREEVRQWLRKEKAWKITKMSVKERVVLEKKLFELKKYGLYIEPKEAEKVYKEIKNYPKRSKAKYGIESEWKRLKILNLLKDFLGK